MILYVEYINCQHRLHYNYYFLLTLRTRSLYVSAFPFRFFSSSPRILLFPPPPFFLSPPRETSSRCPHPAVRVGICSILRNIVGKHELQAVMLKRWEDQIQPGRLSAEANTIWDQMGEKSSGLLMPHYERCSESQWLHRSDFTLWRIWKSDKAVSNDEQHLCAASPYLPRIGLRLPFSLCCSLYML